MPMKIERKKAFEAHCYNKNAPRVNPPLTGVEFKEGYHYCYDWDGLFIGPEDVEWETCQCHPRKDGWVLKTELDEAVKAAKIEGYLRGMLDSGIPDMDVDKRLRRYIEEIDEWLNQMNWTIANAAGNRCRRCLQESM